MDPRTQERVEQWDSRPFSGGYDGLSDLTADGFSGAVTAAGTWLFVLNGRIVGVFGGDLEDVESASGTVYQAPHPSLPLLFSMESQGGDTRAKYYTNDTSLEEVDQTLQDGSFTGYVELSENVLSGDYYAVYYGGRRMAAAFIGNAERLLTGDEAFERAADEVGIYEVVDVDVEVTDVPTDEPAGSDTGDGADDRERANAVSGDGDDDDVTASGPKRAGDTVESVEFDASQSPSDDDEQTGITSTDPAATPGTEDPNPSGVTAASSAEPDPTNEVTDAESTATRSDSSPTAPATESGPVATQDGADSTLDPEEVEAAAAELEESDISWTEDESDEAASNVVGGSSEARDERLNPESDPDSDAALEEQFEEEEQWRETRSIPSIDPEMTTESADASANRSAGSTTQSGQTVTSRQGNPRGGAVTTPQAESSPQSKSTSQAQSQRRSQAQSPSHSQGQSSQSPSRPETDPRAGSSTAGSSNPVEEPRTPQPESAGDSAHTDRIEALEDRREELETKAQRLETERDRLQAENEELTDRIDQLTDRIDELEARLEGADGEPVHTASRTLAPDQALSGTNLFVRYASKSEPTLLTAHDGAADRAEVAGNLHLEHHTEFDETDVAVDGQPYEQFLTDTLVYQFVDWLTAVLLYEIRDTGHADRLGDLYDAIPRVDRAEINGSISLADDETDDVPDSVSFDVVAYDKMGNPLLVVTLNDSREPASEELLRGFEEAASAVKANYPDLAAAIAVTSSYFEPGALEVTDQATSSGFLSRSSKASYVNVSRKQGYHLCLVESQSEGFHMSVPEL